MKTLFAATLLLFVFSFSQSIIAQVKRMPAPAARAEYIEVEKNVRLHVTDLGEGQPIVLIHGWPLNEYRAGEICKILNKASNIIVNVPKI